MKLSRPTFHVDQCIISGNTYRLKTIIEKKSRNRRKVCAFLTGCEASIKTLYVSRRASQVSSASLASLVVLRID